jgi:hypothetical protein
VNLVRLLVQETSCATAKVTTIYLYACRDCTGLTALALPNTLIYIGSGAFKNCAALKELALPASLEHIGSDAFRGLHEAKGAAFASLDPGGPASAGAHEPRATSLERTPARTG